MLFNGVLSNRRVAFSCACLLKSGLKIIFHWIAKLVIAFRSCLKVVALVGILFTTEKGRSIIGKKFTIRGKII